MSYFDADGISIDVEYTRVMQRKWYSSNTVIIVKQGHGNLRRMERKAGDSRLLTGAILLSWRFNSFQGQKDDERHLVHKPRNKPYPGRLNIKQLEVFW